MNGSLIARSAKTNLAALKCASLMHGRPAGADSQDCTVPRSADRALTINTLLIALAAAAALIGAALIAVPPAGEGAFLCLDASWCGPR